MKTICMVLFWGMTLCAQAQVKVLQNTAQIPKNTSAMAPTPLSPVDMTKAVNGFSRADSPDQQAAQKTVKQAEVLAEALAQQRERYLYGDAKPRSYVINYSSAPVKALYDEFVPALVANHTYALTNSAFVDIVADRLGKEAQHFGAYTTPQALAKLLAEARRVLVKADIMNAAAVKPGTSTAKNTYFTVFLNEIFEATRHLLDSKQVWTTNVAPDSGPYASYYPTTFQTATSELSRSQAFMQNQAVDICVESARLVAKKTLPGGKSAPFFTSSFAKNLNLAIQGQLFKSLRTFKGQSSEYEVFSIRLTSLQKTTQLPNGLSAYWDSEWNCPTALAYSVFGANKVKNAIVFNP
jgi:hypothetical protein